MYYSNGQLLLALLALTASRGYYSFTRTGRKRRFMRQILREHLQTKNPEFLKDKDSLDSFLYLMNLVVDRFKAANDWNDVSALKGFDVLEGSPSMNWHRYGYKTFFEILLNTYNEGSGLPTLEIKLNKEVTNIQWPKESTGNVVVTCKDGEQYSAANVIVTISLGVLKERYSDFFSPPLPQDKVTAIDLLNIGVIAKIILQLDKPGPAEKWIMFYWRAEDKKQISDEDKWSTKVLGTSKSAGTNNTLTLWVNGENAKIVEKLPDEVIKTAAMKLLARFVGSDVTLPQITAIMRTTWFSNPFTRGCYSYESTESRKHPGLREKLAAPLLDAGGAPRVLFAGEATSTTHYSTVHGASETGYKEAQRILSSNKI